MVSFPSDRVRGFRKRRIALVKRTGDRDEMTRGTLEVLLVGAKGLEDTDFLCKSYFLSAEISLTIYMEFAPPCPRFHDMIDRIYLRVLIICRDLRPNLTSRLVSLSIGLFDSAVVILFSLIVFDLIAISAHVSAGKFRFPLKHNYSPVVDLNLIVLPLKLLLVDRRNTITA